MDREDFLPHSRLIRWLIAPGGERSPALETRVSSGLYTSIPIFLGGVFNTIAIATAGALRHPTGLFLTWLMLELGLGIVRLCVIVAGRRALKLGLQPPLAVTVLLSCAWAGSVGFGAYISVASADWVLATVTCLSAAAMVCGICLRNYATPRLVAVMMVLSLGPCAVAALLSNEPLLLMVSIQLPIYMAAMCAAAFHLNAMLVGRMAAKEALEKSEAFNRSILDSSPDYTILLGSDRRVLFCNRPGADQAGTEALIGLSWLDLLPPESLADGRQALEGVGRGETARLTSIHVDPAGRKRWFDLAASPVCDGSNRVLVVARDITHQKASEEQAIWMAHHDPLTRLPNRLLLQDRLDALIAEGSGGNSCALLVLDVDNFKLINDTLGHDAGDALLCAFADRLRESIRPDDAVARLGGDEFAIAIRAGSDEEIGAAVERIFAALRQPFFHDGRPIECNASIGASLSPRDGGGRSELMKTADIALYAAKASGRGQLKIFHASMRNQFQSRNSMIALARHALESDGLVPHYQPKVCLRSGAITGFEALLRWRDPAGKLRLPDKLKAAFEDPNLAVAISDRMIDRTLVDMRRWLDEGIDFGHVAINAAAAEFRQGTFAESLLEKLSARRIPPSCLQLEVTETVFLGRGADYVERALLRLSREGVRVALDDFGTGYASLSHLKQFPVDVLKIDRSFIAEIGRNAEAEAITKAVVNLGHSLNIEIVAEGVETAEQEAHLIALGCDTGQGYRYSKAVPPSSVMPMLMRLDAKLA